MGYKPDGQVHGLPKIYSRCSHLEWTACIMPLEAYWMRVKKAQASRCNMPREAFATKWMSWARRYNRPDGAVNVWWSMCVIWAGECTRPDICHQGKKEVAWTMHSQIHSPTCSQWHLNWRTPKSRGETHLLGLPKWSPEIVSAGLPELWTAITPDYGVGSRRGLNQSCSPR
jgi:hypothetical protein